MSRSSAESPPEIHYPDSDGQPMGESGIHVNATLTLFGTLKLYYRRRTDLYFTADMFFYYEQGNPRAVKAPDLMVIKGVESREERRSYKLWVEKRVPAVIFEITSEETRRDDTVIKRDLYARLGVAEYFLFDPLGEYLDPQLQGYRLEDGRYQPIVPDADGKLDCLELGLKFQADEEWVRLIDAATDRRIPHFTELGDLTEQQAEALEGLREDLFKGRKELDRERKKAAREARKADTERQKAEAERQKADAERQKADAERQKADAERQKAEVLEAEVARLRALLEARASGG
jgi:Uma2 family endonuclease